MSWIKPDWYMTPREFADLVVESLEATNHFKSDELAHPEDIVIAFTTQAEAIAIGAGAAGKKVHAANKKDAVMKTGNLRKATEETTNEYDGYSEYKWRNVTIR